VVGGTRLEVAALLSLVETVAAVLDMERGA